MTQIFTAKTVEDAKALAVRAFGAAPEDISFEVIEEPKKTFFGLKKGDARVRATYMSVEVSMEETKPADPEVIETVCETMQEQVTELTAPEVTEAVAENTEAVTEAAAENAEAEEETVQQEQEAQPAEKSAEKDVQGLESDADMISGEPSQSALRKLDRAKEYLTGIIEKLGIQAQFNVTAGAESALIEIVTEKSGAIIGKRGETLDALQYLTFMAANHGEKECYRILLDTANYRARRRRTLEELAAKIAKNVLRSGRQTTLEPMNPYERRIIHAAVAGIEGVSSRSIGDEPYRKVVISSLSKPNRRQRQGDRKDRRSRDNRTRDNRKRNADTPPTRTSMDFMKTSFEKDYQRPKPDAEINAGLYGKIEI